MYKTSNGIDFEPLNTIDATSKDVLTAINGDKFFGFVRRLDAFVSPKIQTIDFEFEREQQRIKFGQIYKNLHRTHKKCRNFCEESFQNAAVYVLESIEKTRMVNDVEATFIFKYFKTQLDKNKKVKFERAYGDLYNLEEFGQLDSITSTYDSNATKFNDVKKIDIIHQKIQNKFGDIKAQFFMDFFQIYTEQAFLKYPQSYGLTPNQARKVKFNILNYLLKEADNLQNEFDFVCYPNFDDINLKNLIND